MAGRENRLLFVLSVAFAGLASPVPAGILAFYDLNGITNANISANQYQTDNQLVYGADLNDWSKSGFNSVHAIQLSGATPGGPGNYAIMIFGDNLITQTTAFAANDLGKTYYASYDIGPTVYADPNQATQAGDQLRINLLRSNDTVFESGLVAPGAWLGTQTFSFAYFSYIGDGTGPLRFQMLSETPNNGRFSGAVDNMAFWDSTPIPSVPEIDTAGFGTCAAIVTGALGLLERRRLKAKSA